MMDKMKCPSWLRWLTLIVGILYLIGESLGGQLLSF